MFYISQLQLKPEDLDNLPAFLEMIKENTLYEKSVKSKNQLYIYGSNLINIEMGNYSTFY